MNNCLIVITIVWAVLLVYGALVLAYALSKRGALQNRLNKFVRR